MIRTLPTSLRVVGVASLAVLLVAAVLTAVAAWTDREAARWVRHTYEVIDHIGQLEAAVARAEPASAPTW